VVPGELQHTVAPPVPQTCALGQQIEPKSERNTSVEPLGQAPPSHWQLEQLRVWASDVQLGTQLPPQSVVPKKSLGQRLLSHRQVEQLKVWSDGQLGTQLPPQSVVSTGHRHSQKERLKN
jgi:hypothetical protein